MKIIEYPKIQTIWKRDMGKGKKGAIIVGDFSEPIFNVFPMWHVTEKVDGTNVRIIYDPGPLPKPQFRGKTDDAQLHSGVWAHLQETFTPEKLAATFPERAVTDDPHVNHWPEVIIFGEAYGAKIQDEGGIGARYRPDQGVIIYDILIDGYWLEYENVVKLAEKLGVPVVPSLGVMRTIDAINLIAVVKPLSIIAKTPRPMGGIVATAAPMVLDRKTKTPVKWKLKVKDYNALQKNA